jgi:hypothetical protein
MIDYLSKPEDYKFWLYAFYNHYEPEVIYNGDNTREFLNRHCNFSEYYEKRKHKIKKILTKYFKKFFIESKRYRPFVESDFELIEKDDLFIFKNNNSCESSFLFLGIKENGEAMLGFSTKKLLSCKNIRVCCFIKDSKNLKLGSFNRIIINIENKSVKEIQDLILKTGLKTLNKFYLPNY